MNDILQRLQIVLEQRKLATDEQSYVASLHKAGLNKILKKMGEECTETVLAAKDAAVTGDNTQLIYETADLWFHTLVMLSHLDENVDAVLRELERRMGTSGLAEKAARKDK